MKRGLVLQRFLVCAVAAIASFESADLRAEAVLDTSSTDVATESPRTISAGLDEIVVTARRRSVTTISSNPAEIVLGLSVATSVLDVSRTASARRSADSNEAIAATAHTRNRCSTNPRFILFSLVSQEPWVAESRPRHPHSFCPSLSRPRNYKLGNSAFQSKNDDSTVFSSFYLYIS